MISRSAKLELIFTTWGRAASQGRDTGVSVYGIGHGFTSQIAFLLVKHLMNKGDSN